MSSRASYRQGLSFGMLSFGSMLFLGVFSSVVIARMYGVEVLGQYALVTAPVNIMASLTTLQLQAALIKELAVLERRAPRITGLFAAVWVFTFLITLVVAPLVALGGYLLLAGPVDQPNLISSTMVLMGGYLLVHNTAWTIESVLSSFRAGKELFWIRTWRAVAFLALAIFFGLTWDSVWGLVVAEIGSRFISLIQALFAVRPIMRARVDRQVIREGFRELPEMARFGIKVAPAGVADSVTFQSGTWFLGALAPIATVGAWKRAQMLGSRFQKGNHRIYEMLFPTLVERRASGDVKGFDRAVIDTLRYVAIGFMYPAAVGGGAAVAVMEVFGPGFEQAAGALAVLLLLPAVFGVANMLGAVLVAVDRPLVATGLQFLRTGVTVATSIPLILAFGVTGAALALLCGYLSDFQWRWRLASRYLNEPVTRLWPVRQMFALALAFVAGFGVARVVDQAVDGFPLGLLAAGSTGTLAYFGVLFLAGGVTERDRKRLKGLIAGRGKGLRKRRPAAAGGS